MTKSKTNALEALRALISERQQYDQWILTLESKREGTPEHVFNRVYSDYRSRRDRVVEEIKGHSEELQLSINALSSRLGEVAKEEEARRDTLQEAELRAAVGEYDEGQWESLRADANRELDKIAADRGSLENQLAELDSIRKLSEVSDSGAGVSMPTAAPAVASAAPQPARPPAPPPEPVKAEVPSPAPAAPPVQERKRFEPPVEQSNVDRPAPGQAGWPTRDIVEQPVAAAPPPPAAPAPRPFSGPPEPLRATTDPAAAVPRPSAMPPSPAASPAPPARKKRDTPSGRDAEISSGFSKPLKTPTDSRPEVNKSLKCPECGTANYPTEWYCERCGGELATM
jgi:hypothetical protein